MGEPVEVEASRIESTGDGGWLLSVGTVSYFCPGMSLSKVE